MKLVLSLVICVFLAAHGSTRHASSHRRSSGGKPQWGYENWDVPADVLKPDQWSTGTGYKPCNNEKMKQSPINLSSNEAKERTFLITKNKNMKGNWKNNGHAPTNTLRSDSVVEFECGEKKYRLEQFHFHFGCESGRGSEHTVDGRAFEGELHFVFYDSTNFKNFGEAFDKPSGLTVFGVFLKEEGEKGNAQLNNILEQLKTIVYAAKPDNEDDKQEDEDEDEEGIDLTALAKQLFEENTKYYSYEGSLTTPPCYESVNWKVMAEPLKVTSAQMKEFRKLLRSQENDPAKKTMCDNYRPVQNRD